MDKPVYILNGPNLNLLGKRQPEIYGTQSLSDIEAICTKKAESLGLTVVFRQTNFEGELVELIQEAGTKACGLILNAAAYTHTSIALMDALKACGLISIEVHLSNVFAREAFRHKSYVSPAVTGMICGFGAKGYELALEALSAKLAGQS
ncbi:MAG TPA: type II 3-dehydroquinate dehydratase [Rhizobiales bacterium]|nr:type II 3-dehydroquinate dehydratase [Hyphomicrobiales bacterium]